MGSKGVKQADLAGILKISQAAVSKWMNGSIPKGDQLYAVSNYFKVPMEWLLTGKGPDNLSAVASLKMSREFAEMADRQGGTDEEKQAEFERLQDMKLPLIEEINQLREDNRALKKRIDLAVKALTVFQGNIKVVQEPDEVEPMTFPAPFYGAVAAGEPVEVPLNEEIMIGEECPPDHFVVEVNGESMEPTLMDGDRILCDGHEKYTPRHGAICIISDGHGSSVKRWNRKKGVFESDNPDYPDLVLGDECKLQGYFVRKVAEVSSRQKKQHAKSAVSPDDKTRAGAADLSHLKDQSGDGQKHA